MMRMSCALPCAMPHGAWIISIEVSGMRSSSAAIAMSDADDMATPSTVPTLRAL